MLGLDVFVDDTNLMAATSPLHSQQTPIHLVQHNLTLWHDLQKTSNGVLNPSKCVWFWFHWKQNAWGTVKITVPPVNTSQSTSPHSQTKPHQSISCNHMKPIGTLAFSLPLMATAKRNSLYFNSATPKLSTSYNNASSILQSGSMMVKPPWSYSANTPKAYWHERIDSA